MLSILKKLEGRLAELAKDADELMDASCPTKDPVVWHKIDEKIAIVKGYEMALQDVRAEIESEINAMAVYYGKG